MKRTRRDRDGPKNLACLPAHPGTFDLQSSIHPPYHPLSLIRNTVRRGEWPFCLLENFCASMKPQKMEKDRGIQGFLPEVVSELPSFP